MAKIAIPLAEDFEDSEYTVPRDRLCGAGHSITVIGPKAGATVVGKRGKARVTVDAPAKDVDPAAFDAVVIPGGYSPDHLRIEPDVADAVVGKTLTSWPSVRKDLQNAGATWKDAEVVEDGNLITSRKPDDLEAFSRAILSRLAHAAPRQAAGAIGA